MTRTPLWVENAADSLALAVVWRLGVQDQKTNNTKIFQEVLELLYDDLESTYQRGYRAGVIAA